MNDELERVAAILSELRRLYPSAHCALDYRDPFELTVATILSAQSTDVRVNLTTPALFARYPDAAALAAARQQEVEAIIKSCGFFRNKAKNIIGMARKVIADHGGAIPREMAEMLELPGVARKTANVVLGNAFGIASGVVVDTHVTRLSHRLCLSRERDPVKIERDLTLLTPRDRWIVLAHELIAHGRQVCDARRPRCGECSLAPMCPSAASGGEPPTRRRSAAELLAPPPKSGKVGRARGAKTASKKAASKKTKPKSTKPERSPATRS